LGKTPERRDTWGPGIERNDNGLLREGATQEICDRKATKKGSPKSGIAPQEAEYAKGQSSLGGGGLISAQGGRTESERKGERRRREGV